MTRIILMTLGMVTLGPCQAAEVAEVPEISEISRAAVGANPHGMQIVGDRAYIAAAGDNAIEVLDLESGEVVERWPVPDTPLDIVPVKDGWLVSSFGADTLTFLDADGNPGKTIKVGKGPSLFNPRPIHRFDGNFTYIVSEFADQLTVIDTDKVEIVATYETGDRPYPADVTHDGVLAFVPNRDEGTVSVIDLLNGEELARVAVCEHPSGGSLTADEVSYIVACAGSDMVKFINTASFEVTATVSEGIGPRPFAVAVSEDGRLAFVNNAGGTTLSVIDLATMVVSATPDAGEQPIVQRVVGDKLYVGSEVSNTFHVFGLPVAPVKPVLGTAKNEVFVLGMIHDGFLTSERYSLDVLRQAIRNIDPDFVIVEIPPNRLDAAIEGFQETGEVTERRAKVFPEYVDVLFPLTREMDFEIIGGAAWNRYMNSYRSKVRRRLRSDPAYAHAWSEEDEASDISREAMRGRGDDPVFIHSDEYDEITRTGLQPYQQYFNDVLGPGGWKNINEGHYRLIARALDAHRGEGKRFLITFGASHKYWIMDELRQRDDLTLRESRQFFQ